jgi:uncharacterized protein
MSAITFPTQIEPFKAAEQDFSWSGIVPLARFKRIAREAVSPVDDLGITLSCRLHEDDRGVAWLSAHLVTTVNLTCQRCLAAVEETLDTTVLLAILADQAHAERISEDADYVVLSEEQLAHGADDDCQTIDLIEWLEDELLLSVPLSPRHEQCEMAVKPAAADEPVRQANPFGILASLKRGSDA